MKKLLCLLILFLVTSGCATFVERPVVSVKDLNVISLDSGGAGMELYLAVENKNSFDVTLLGYNYDIKVMALPLAKGGARDGITFPAQDTTDVRIPFRVTYSDLVEILKRKPNPDDIPYNLVAGLELDTPVGVMTVPVEQKGHYAIPKKYRPSFLLGKLGDLFSFGK